MIYITVCAENPCNIDPDKEKNALNQLQAKQKAHGACQTVTTALADLYRNSPNANSVACKNSDTYLMVLKIESACLRGIS